MKREIVNIDREKCNGCGECIPNCHEGALQMIDGKATLVSELMCDGLGACIGHCPVDAITIETREAEAYDEVLTVKEILKNGKNVLIAHLKHLKEHNELVYLKEAVSFLRTIESELKFDLGEVVREVHNMTDKAVPMEVERVIEKPSSGCGGGCPGSKTMSFDIEEKEETKVSGKSQLRQWPVQLHLVNPAAQYFKNADLLIAADCVAFSLGNFHQDYLKGKGLAIACPKLDSNQDTYLQKLIEMIEDSKINTITVMIMEVPCCGGLLAIARRAQQTANRHVPIKAITVGIQGDIVNEVWY